MNDGDAASWKSQYLTEAKTPTGLNKVPGDALEIFTALKMGNMSIEDYVARYKILITKAGIQ